MSLVVPVVRLHRLEDQAAETVARRDPQVGVGRPGREWGGSSPGTVTVSPGAMTVPSGRMIEDDCPSRTDRHEDPRCASSQTSNGVQSESRDALHWLRLLLLWHTSTW